HVNPLQRAGPIRVRAEIPSATRKRPFLNHAQRRYGPCQVTPRAIRVYGLNTISWQAAGFCVRTSDPELTRELEDCVGQGWAELLARLGGRIVRVSPSRVILSPIGRVEVFTPIPLPNCR